MAITEERISKFDDTSREIMQSEKLRLKKKNQTRDSEAYGTLSKGLTFISWNFQKERRKKVWINNDWNSPSFVERKLSKSKKLSEPQRE